MGQRACMFHSVDRLPPGPKSSVSKAKKKTVRKNRRHKRITGKRLVQQKDNSRRSVYAKDDNSQSYSAALKQIGHSSPSRPLHIAPGQGKPSKDEQDAAMLLLLLGYKQEL